MSVKWGIISTGGISKDFCTAIGLVPKMTESKIKHEIYSVAARNPDSAKQFHQKFQTTTFHQNYNELIADKNIDIIYIGAIHPYHYELTKAALNNGKHVLCEKPVAMNATEAEELFQLAKEKNLLLCEGMWSRFNPIYQKIKELIQSGKLGKILNASACLSFDGRKIPRIVERKLGGSAILDIGIYPMQFCLFAFDDQDPIDMKIMGAEKDDPNNQQIDTIVNINMHFKNGGFANVYSSTLKGTENYGKIIGEKGHIYVEDFWCTKKAVVYLNENPDEIYEKFESGQLPDDYADSDFTYKNSQNLTYEAAEVGETVCSRKTECQKWTAKNTLRAMKIVDRFFVEITGKTRSSRDHLD